MVALFVIGMVVVLLTIDLILASRGKASLAQRLMASQENPKAQVVAGFHVAPGLCYHPGHSWAALKGEAARVGIDEFASRLIGTPEAVELPAVGTQVRAGRPLARLTRRGRRTSVVAPVSGTVVAVNREVAQNPALLGSEPYGAGWLVEVQGEGLRFEWRSLLSGELARRWMDDSAAALHRFFNPAQALPVAADGGLAVDGIADQFDDETWNRVSSRLLLTDPE